MILQKMIYPVIGDCEELYYKQCNCEIDKSKGIIRFMDIGSRIDFSTYFNMFSYGKWNKYTDCGDVGISLTLKGSIILLVKGLSYRNGNVLEEVIVRTTLSSSTYNNRTVSCDGTDYEFLSISFECLEENTKVSDVAYVSVQSTLEAKDVKLGLCICTYNRKDELLSNLKLIEDSFINNPLSLLMDKLQVFISDNAGILEERQDKYIHIIHNKNYGGSGGFTRAMLEAMNSDVTHLLLMDDDISFEVGVLERTYTFLQLLKDEYRDAFLGAGMLIRDKQYMQHAAGETDDCVGIHFDKRDYDLRDLGRVLANEQDVGSNYLGWWYMAMPREIVDSRGYSYPMFVQYDDIEFSIRNSDCVKINVNGIGVWHEDFEHKKNPVKVYYTIRNRLISHSLCYGRFLPVRRMGECILKSFGRMRRGCYYEGVLVLMAIRDYLKGPEYIGTIDMERKNNELYAYARREDAPRPFIGWCRLIGQWIELFIRLILHRKSLIKHYQDSANYYTSREYWIEKLR